MANPNRQLKLLTVALLFSLAGSAGAAESALDRLSGDYDYCVVCHGAKAQGNIAIQAPALAGIEPWYLRSRLQAYRSRFLGADFARDPAGTEMRIAVRELTDARLPDVVAYVAQFKPVPQARTLRGDVDRGRRLYAEHCLVCHGERGVGNEQLHAPGLQRLNDWYLVAAYAKYRAGLRGTASEDVFGAQMGALAGALPADFAINDVAAYLQSVQAAGIRRGTR